MVTYVLHLNSQETPNVGHKLGPPGELWIFITLFSMLLSFEHFPEHSSYTPQQKWLRSGTGRYSSISKNKHLFLTNFSSLKYYIVKLSLWQLGNFYLRFCYKANCYRNNMHILLKEPKQQQRFKLPLFKENWKSCSQPMIAFYKLVTSNWRSA